MLIIQQHTIDRLRGRTFTLIISAHNALLGLAMIAAGALTERRRRPLDVCGRAGVLAASGGLTAYVLARGLRPGSAVARELAA